MVKVIDETPDPEVVKRTSCRNCGVRLEYVPMDVKEDYSTDMYGGKDFYRYITCPKCSNQVHVRY